MSQKILIEKTASALKRAAATIDALQQENKNLLVKIASQELVIMSHGRSRQADDLAREMLKKGLISKDEFDSKVDEIMKMDESAYKALKDVVSKATASKDEAFLEDNDPSPENDPVEKKASAGDKDHTSQKIIDTLGIKI